jgi:HEAT repeat protein
VSKRDFEDRLRMLDALRRTGDPAAAAPELKKALKDRSNFMAKKAAQVAAELGLAGLMPELLAAYGRFFDDPVKKDPQCWAKTAIAAALKDLGYDEPEPFYRGLAHVQWEPVWGGQEDSAGALRATCLVALPACRADTMELLVRMTDALADRDKGVRAEAAAAIAHLGHEAGAAILRLKARLGDEEPEVLGRCFSGLLALEAFDPVGFVQGFLGSTDELERSEAAGALAAANQPQAFEAVRRFWQAEPDARRLLALALAASPFEQAAELWREAIEKEPIPVAEAAIEAFAASRFREKLTSEMEQAVNRRDSASLHRTWREHASEARP